MKNGKSSNNKMLLGFRHEKVISNDNYKAIIGILLWPVGRSKAVQTSRKKATFSLRRNWS